MFDESIFGQLKGMCTVAYILSKDVKKTIADVRAYDESIYCDTQEINGGFVVRLSVSALVDYGHIASRAERVLKDHIDHKSTPLFVATLGGDDDRAEEWVSRLLREGWGQKNG